MQITVFYDGASFEVKDTAENREALREVGTYVAEGRSENLILELASDAQFIAVMGPAIPLAVVYSG